MAPVDMTSYQHAAAKTLQPLPRHDDQLVVALLGLAGEAGAVMTAYKKQLRDGAADPGFRTRMREELGDALWYLSTVAHQLNLDLNDIATANLTKITDRWRPTPSNAIPFDTDLDPHEQLPRQAEFTFTLTRDGNREVSVLTCEGQQVGDPITDASHITDGYHFHDAFHLSYAAVLGWSPVIRALLGRKRRSNPQTDEAEDGGRAIAIEEGIVALVFGYASRHQYLEGKTHVDNDILDTIQGMVAHLEVSAHRAADWEKAILTGFDVWRTLRRLGGGTVRLDLNTQSLKVIEADTEPPAPPHHKAPDAFRAAVATLHRSKDAAYGDSWKRRGEQISIMANIARKIDRLNILGTTGAAATTDENAIDTATDLLVYALKYLTYLADLDTDVLALVPANPGAANTWSDGPDGFEVVLDTTNLTALAAEPDEPLPRLIAAAARSFGNLEGCFSITGATTTARRRAELAQTLAADAVRIVAQLRATSPELFNAFISTWRDPSQAGTPAR
jgi:NTP pyrophosphatase (non-canonical NTP hydrolase)